MCRGSVVNEQALIRALNEGTIAGAGLDTTEIEPLPVESLLWDARNVMITPHNTPTVPDRLGNSLQIILTNIERYRNEQALVNLLTSKDVYTHQ
jgi:phosphoglycerate dehydrogenase-like enzyme